MSESELLRGAVTGAHLDKSAPAISAATKKKPPRKKKGPPTTPFCNIEPSKKPAKKK